MSLLNQQVPEGFRRISVILSFVAATVAVLVLINVLLAQGFYSFPPKAYVRSELVSTQFPFVSVHDVLPWWQKHPALRSMSEVEKKSEVHKYAGELNSQREREAKRDMILFWCAFVVAPPLCWLIVRAGSGLIFKALFWVMYGFKKKENVG